MCTFINESKDINSTALLTRFSKSIALRFEHNLEIQTTLIKGEVGEAKNDLLKSAISLRIFTNFHNSMLLVEPVILASSSLRT